MCWNPVDSSGGIFGWPVMTLFTVTCNVLPATSNTVLFFFSSDTSAFTLHYFSRIFSLFFFILM